MIRTQRAPALPGSQARRSRLSIAVPAVVIILIVGVLAVAWWLRGGSEVGTVEYTTESGSSRGVINSPLKVTLRVPWSSDSPETALASVSLQLMDERGSPAVFGSAALSRLAMTQGERPDLWVFEGSVPGKPGRYTARFTTTPYSNPSGQKTFDVRAPVLQGLPESLPPLTSGFVFSSGRDLWIMSSDAARQRRLTFFERAARYPNEPAWSPDAQTVAFAYQPPVASDQVPTSDIWTVNPGGSEPTLLVKPGPLEVLADPAWSDDGRYLYFAVDTLPDNATGSGSAQLEARRIDRLELATGARTRFALGMQMPAAGGPRGELVAVEDTPPSDPGGSPGHQLVVLGADGARKSVLVGPGRYPAIYAPHMSPDGRWVVFAAPNGKPARKEANGLLEWLMITPAVAHAHDIPWDLFLIPAGGGRVERLTDLDEDQPHPTWLSNSALAFLGETGLYKVAVSGGGRSLGEPTRLREGADHGALTWHGP